MLRRIHPRRPSALITGVFAMSACSFTVDPPPSEPTPGQGSDVDGAAPPDLTTGGVPQNAWLDMLVVEPPDLASPKSPLLPFVVDSVFSASGCMGDTGDIVQVPSLPNDPNDCGGDRSSPTAQGACHVITYTPKGKSKWAGVYWQYPTGNWGTQAGYPVPYGATQVVFQAKGDSGGERVKFFVGGLGNSMAHSDSVSAAQTWTLTNHWVQYTIDITGQTYTEVLGGFGWSMGAAQAGSSATFSVDDIQWQ
jgi:hypothetical protein